MSEPATTPDDVPSARVRRRLSGIFEGHDFFRDLLVTTLGVLIALGIGELVEEFRWKLRIEATEKAMNSELGLVYAVYLAEIELQPCVARRISELDEVISDLRRTGRAPAIANISFPPNYGGFGDSWALTTGSEIPLKMSPERVLQTATLWANEDIHTDLVNRLRDAFDRLLILENRPGPLPDGLLNATEQDLVTIKNAVGGIQFIARRDGDALKEKGVTPMFSPDVPLDRKILAAESPKRLICKPLLIDGKPYRLRGKPFATRPSATG